MDKIKKEVDSGIHFGNWKLTSYIWDIGEAPVAILARQWKLAPNEAMDLADLGFPEKIPEANKRGGRSWKILKQHDFFGMESGSSWNNITLKSGRSWNIIVMFFEVWRVRHQICHLHTRYRRFGFHHSIAGQHRYAMHHASLVSFGGPVDVSGIVGDNAHSLQRPLTLSINTVLIQRDHGKVKIITMFSIHMILYLDEGQAQKRRWGGALSDFSKGGQTQSWASWFLEKQFSDLGTANSLQVKIRNALNARNTSFLNCQDSPNCTWLCEPVHRHRCFFLWIHRPTHCHQSHHDLLFSPCSSNPQHHPRPPLFWPQALKISYDGEMRTSRRTSWESEDHLLEKSTNNHRWSLFFFKARFITNCKFRFETEIIWLETKKKSSLGELLFSCPALFGWTTKQMPFTGQSDSTLDT